MSEMEVTQPARTPPPPLPGDETGGEPEVERPGDVAPESVGDARRGAGRLIDPRERARGANARLGRQAVNVVTSPSPKLGLPGFLLDRRVVVYSWVVAMIMVGINEYQNGFILPRPQRLWSTSAVFFILAMGSSVDEMTPVVNALAVGYAMILVYQYYNKEGIFSSANAQSLGQGISGRLNPGVGSGSTTKNQNPPPSTGGAVVQG